MPAKGTRLAGTRRARVLDWYREHPGFHRCQDVAAALGEPTQQVASISRDLMLLGDIERRWGLRERPGTKPISLYGTEEP
jgi:hypothetical protein